MRNSQTQDFNKKKKINFIKTEGNNIDSLCNIFIILFFGKSRQSVKNVPTL